MNSSLIFDTTIWIDFLNKKTTAKTDLLQKYISENWPVIIIPIIMQEILQGIENDYYFNEIKDLLAYFPLLGLPGTDVAIGAATLYRSLRKKGITIRKSNDCIIAFYAIHFDIALVHNDADFDKIALHAKLKIAG